MSERLHKLLAQHGLGSRREIEKWMLAGRVLLNDRPAQPGDRYSSGDRVVIDDSSNTELLHRLEGNLASGVALYRDRDGDGALDPDPELLARGR